MGGGGGGLAPRAPPQDVALHRVNTWAAATSLNDTDMVDFVFFHLKTSKHWHVGNMLVAMGSTASAR